MKKQYILLAVLLIVVGAVVTLSIYKYNQQPKGITVSQAVSQRDTALLALKTEKLLTANDTQAIANLTSDKNDLQAQKTTLCAQITAAKLIQPLCK